MCNDVATGTAVAAYAAIHRAFPEGTVGEMRCIEGRVGFRNGREESHPVVTRQIYHPGEETVKRFPIDSFTFLSFPPYFLLCLSVCFVFLSCLIHFLSLFLPLSFCLVYLGRSFLHCSIAAIVTAAVRPITSLRFTSS